MLAVCRYLGEVAEWPVRCWREGVGCGLGYSPHTNSVPTVLRDCAARKANLQTPRRLSGSRRYTTDRHIRHKERLIGAQEFDPRIDASPPGRCLERNVAFDYHFPSLKVVYFSSTFEYIGHKKPAFAVA